MAFPQVRSTNGGSEGNSTAPSYTLPATIESGDLILVIAGTDNTATFTVPSGFTNITSQNASVFQFQVFGKVADGTEDSTTVDGTLTASESTCYIALAIQDWSGDINDVEVGTIVNGSGTSADPGSVTASWGSDDNLFIAAAIGDDYNKAATAYPTGYTGNQLTQNHANAFGGNQAVSIATRELASATDDPSAFTLSTGTNSDFFGTLAIVVKPAGVVGPSITDVDTDEIVVDGQTSVSVTVAGFGGDITGFNLKNGTDTEALSFTGSGTSYSVDLPDVSAYTSTTSGVPFDTASHNIVLEATRTGESAELDIARNPKSGWAVVEIASAVTTPASVFKAFEGTVPDTSQVLYTTADSTSVASNGELTSDSEVNLSMKYWDATEKNWQTFSVILTAVGIPLANRKTDNDVRSYLRSQGYSPSADGLMAFLEDEGFTNGTINDRMNAYLDSLGYTGTLADKMAAWRRA